MVFSIFKKTKKYVPSTEEEAWVAVLYGVMASDGEIANEELDRLVDFCSTSPKLAEVDVVEHFKVVGKFARQHGFETVLEEAPKFIKSDKEDLANLLVEMIKADGFVLSEEIGTLKAVCKALELDFETFEKAL